MRILAIETSCDETAVAVLECSGGLDKPVFKVLGNALNSQIDIHKEFGGVVPNLAKREHEKWLPILLDVVFKKVCFDTERPNIDLIAVTAGPGLEPALWTGITFAESLGKKWHIPVMPVNHMEGHILSVLLREPQIPNSKFPRLQESGGQAISNEIEFPALALLVSGGHTEIVLVSDYGSYQILGRTRDDAVGEAFDKVARVLGLPYPGGPEVAKLAAEDRSEHAEPELTFTIPMLNSKDLDFSYSGLKTAVLYKAKDLGTLRDTDKRALARAFEDAAIGALVEKTRHALDEHLARTLIVGGGVSANAYLKESLSRLIEEYPDTTLIFPERSLSTDNAIMIGIAAYIESHRQDPSSAPIRAEGNLSL